MEGVRLLICLIWIELFFSFTNGSSYDPNLHSHRSRAKRGEHTSRPRFKSSHVRYVFAVSQRTDQEDKNNDHCDDTARKNTVYEGDFRQSTEQKNVAVLRHLDFQASTLKALRLSSHQETFEEATRVLCDMYNLTLSEITFMLPETDLRRSLGKDSNIIDQCESMRYNKTCDENCCYRTIDGTCNNLKNPWWGMSGGCFKRLLQPAYADGISEPRRARCGKPLPKARHVSLKIHSHLNRPNCDVTHMAIIFGQFLDHDISLSPMNSQGENNQTRQCCPGNIHNDSECLQIDLDKNDPFFGDLNITCLQNARTQKCLTCKLGPREQMNQLTHYIDASQMYSVNMNTSRNLRTLDGTGMMRSQMSCSSGELLPPIDDPENDPCSTQDPCFDCFLAGDSRANQHPALTCLHTLFVREHNRIAKKLKKINCHWDDEMLFQESRRIVGAEMQIIAYKEFVPLVIGPKYMKWFDLWVRSCGYTHYDCTLQANVPNEFSTAAFRFGHSMVNSPFLQLAGWKRTIFDLRDFFGFPFGLYRRQMDTLIPGLVKSPAQQFDRHMIPDLTNHLYQAPGNKSGLDLASLNVLRGRDHGIPGYIHYVKYCGGPKICCFKDLEELFEPEYVSRFQNVYDHVDDIDLFSGGLAERPIEGAIVGPTFAYIIGTGFHRLKFGDRFYFEHGEQAGSFTKEQLHEIRKISLAKIICDNINTVRIQKDVMRYPSKRNPVVSCDRIKGMNLHAWRN